MKYFTIEGDPKKIVNKLYVCSLIYLLCSLISTLIPNMPISTYVLVNILPYIAILITFLKYISALIIIKSLIDALYKILTKIDELK